MNASFHLAFPIKNLEETTKFYCDILGCSKGRKTTNWIDINFFGNQITALVNEDAVCSTPTYRSSSSQFPIYHFGAVLTYEAWDSLVQKLKSMKINFLVEPKVVFKGDISEQSTFFLLDPNGYAIEFKSFRNMENLFRTNGIS